MKPRPRAENTRAQRPERAALALGRLGAFGLDQVVVAVYLAGLVASVWLVSELGFGSFVRAAFEEPLRAQLLGLLVVTLPVVMYHAVWEGSRVGATPGKLLLGVKVIATDGRSLPLERAMLRAGVKALPWEIAHTVLWRLPGWPGAVDTIPPGALAGLALAWILVGVWLLGLFLDREGRTAYDRTAGAVVVRARSKADPQAGASSGVRARARPRLDFRGRVSEPSVRGMWAGSRAARHPSAGIQR